MPLYYDKLDAGFKLFLATKVCEFLKPMVAAMAKAWLSLTESKEDVDDDEEEVDPAGVRDSLKIIISFCQPMAAAVNFAFPLRECVYCSGCASSRPRSHGLVSYAGHKRLLWPWS